MSKPARAVGPLPLAAAVASLAVAAAGCGGTPSQAAAGRPEWSHLPVSSASESPGAGASVPSRTSPAAHPAASRAPAPGSASASPAATPSVSARPVPSARGHGGTATLSPGFYVDARAVSPHYVLSVARRGPGVITGAVNYLYQGGATFVGQYTGTLSGSGRLTLRFSTGKVLAGSYQENRLSLAGCSALLPRATSPGGCNFAYNGNVPD